jgi:hypothetical protein
VGSDNELGGVSATSSRDAWAVGSDGGRALIEHWNGRAWKVQASPTPFFFKDQSIQLSGVAATSSTNAWAVGYYAQLRGERETRTLIEHWNGRSWKVQASPKPRGFQRYNELSAVAATSSTDAWAVGAARNRTLIEHWNGKAWKIQASPKLRLSALSGVAATSSRNAWAVGKYNTTPYDGSGRALIEHWNGRAWKIQPSPNERSAPPGELDSGIAVDNQLYAVAATSSTDAWAVGWPIKRAPIWQWNGKAWKAQASPKPGGMALNAVAAKSSNIWAVGADYGTAHNRYEASQGNGHPHKGLAVHCVSSSSG